VSERVSREGLSVAHQLAAFIEIDALPGTGITPTQFWAGLAALVAELGPKNRDLLQTREDIQTQLDNWYISHRGVDYSFETYQDFLKETGYLVDEGPDFKIETQGIDPEIAQIAGPQLVVPVMNARFALNAANARWGSLYDALYGTDAMGDLPPAGAYDQARGDRVVAWGRAFLDDSLPLAKGSWSDVSCMSQTKDGFCADDIGLTHPEQFIGRVGDGDSLGGYIFKNNDLHIIVDVDSASVIGAADRAGISDIRMESAISTIMDCEDSVAAVDGADKTLAYRNWLGLMKRDLSEAIVKGSETFTRRLNADITYTTAQGLPAHLKGRSLMLVRNVGHLMTTPAVLDQDGAEIGEGLLDALCTTMIAMHDLNSGRRCMAPQKWLLLMKSSAV